MYRVPSGDSDRTKGERDQSTDGFVELSAISVVNLGDRSDEGVVGYENPQGGIVVPRGSVVVCVFPVRERRG